MPLMGLPDLATGLAKILGTSGDQRNPAVQAQLAEQAGPAIPPLLQAPQGPQRVNPSLPAGPTNPAIVNPPAPRAMPYTTQPTTSPTGEIPQEMAPGGPILEQTNKFYNEAMKQFKPLDRTRMDQALKGGEDAYDRGQATSNDQVELLKQGLNQYLQMPQGIDFTPLAALSDSIYGGNLSQAARAVAPETPEQKLKNMFGMQGKIAELKGQISDRDLSFLKDKLNQLNWMEQHQIEQEKGRAGIAEAGMKALPSAGMAMQRLGLQNDRLNLMTEKEARGSVNNDPMLKQYAPRLEGAAKIGELIQAAKSGKVVSNQALLGQVNAEIARLETGSQSPGLGASEKTELQDRKAQLQSYFDSITGDPKAAVRPEVLQTGQKLVDELGGSYMKGVDSRMDMLRSGMRPGQQAIVDQKHKSLIDTYSPRFGGWHGLNEVAGAPGGAPAVDADLSKLSPAELQQYIQTHGGK